MTFKSIIGATCTCLAVTSFNASAASFVYDIDSNITGIAGLDIDGTTWDMTLHEGTFDDLLSAQPDNALYTESFAQSAALALILFTNSVPEPVYGDFIGCASGLNNCFLSTAYAFNGTHYDTWNDSVKPGGDGLVGSHSYYQNIYPEASLATWELSNISAVPVPAAVWLFSSGLLGLVGVAKRKKV